MKIKFLQKAFDILRGKKYLKLYPPIYNEHRVITCQKPNIYNEFGDKMDAFFLRDRHISETPYWSNSKYFLWDRFNYGLDTHFYTGNAMLKTMGTPSRKYGFLLEPRVKQPKDYSRIEKNKNWAKEFTNILTHDEKLLDNTENAIFFPGCAAIWVDEKPINHYENKPKMVSMVSSHKKMCPLHYLRIDVANKCKKENLADTYGTFDGGGYVPMIDVLKDYRYTIAFENYVSPYFFTERILSAFMTMTVPIYIGATEVSKFFNPDGMIIIDEEQACDIEKVLKQCSVQDYEQRLEAMKDNYNRTLRYLNSNDLLYELLFLEKGEQPNINFEFFNRSV